MLYGVFQKSEDWRNRLHRKLAHKSLDIADTEDVNVDNSRIGMGWKELAVLGALGLGGFHLYGKQTSPTPPPTPAQQASPIDSEYEVRFFDAAGNPIDVPNISQRK